MKIGFIGFGNMAKAIAHGLIEKNVVSKSDLFFSTRSEESKTQVEKTWHIKGLVSNQAVIDESDVIILAVKPYQVEEVLTPLTFSKDKLVLSVMAGVTNHQLSQYIDAKQVIRTMPNLNAQVLESMTAVIENSAVSEKKMTLATDLFSAIGDVVVIPEEQLSVFIALAGSSPALVFLFIDTLARTAVKYGMSKEQATNIAAQAVLGSGKTVLQSNDSPWNLIDQVSSPGGITVEAVLHLLKSDFSGALIEAVDSMIEKDQDMSKGD